MSNEFLTKRTVKATFNPSADSTKRTIAAHGLGVFIPKNAIITNAYYDVVTTFESTAGGADKATIALSVKAANDLVAAIAIEAAGDVYDAGIRGTLVANYAARTVAGDTAVLAKASYAASLIKTDANYELTATVAEAALTAGKLNLYVEYTISE